MKKGFRNKKRKPKSKKWDKVRNFFFRCREDVKIPSGKGKQCEVAGNLCPDNVDKDNKEPNEREKRRETLKKSYDWAFDRETHMHTTERIL